MEGLACSWRGGDGHGLLRAPDRFCRLIAAQRATLSITPAIRFCPLTDMKLRSADPKAAVSGQNLLLPLITGTERSELGEFGLKPRNHLHNVLYKNILHESL